MEQNKKKKIGRWRWLVWVLAGVFVLSCSSVCWIFYRYAVKPMAHTSFMVYVDKDMSEADLYVSLEQGVQAGELSRLKRLMRLKGYDPAKKPGAYRVDSTMSVYDVYKMLSAGWQTPDRLEHAVPEWSIRGAACGVGSASVRRAAGSTGRRTAASADCAGG